MFAEIGGDLPFSAAGLPIADAFSAADLPFSPAFSVVALPVGDAFSAADLPFSPALSVVALPFSPAICRTRAADVAFFARFCYNGSVSRRIFCRET